MKALERENSLLKDEKQRRASEEQEDWKKQLERQVEQITRLKEDEYKSSLSIIQAQNEGLQQELDEVRQKLGVRDR